MRGSGREAGLRVLATGYVRALPDHPLLDRIVRGRAWIPLLGVMLAGIVAMQVEVLKYGAGIGRSLQRSAVLQSRNELLRASVSSLSDDARIERLAAARGMAMPPPSAVTFVHSGPAALSTALSNIRAPSPQSFGSLSTGAAGTATTTPTAGAPVGASTSSPGTGAAVGAAPPPTSAGAAVGAAPPPTG